LLDGCPCVDATGIRVIKFGRVTRDADLGPDGAIPDNSPQTLLAPDDIEHTDRSHSSIHADFGTELQGFPCN
jgi:hypothetical protein